MKKLIPLVDGAAALGASYNQTLRLVLLGQLRGERVHGHWMVEEDDLERARQVLQARQSRAKNA